MKKKSSCSIFPPLVVDLDGTLIKTDLLLESIFALIKQNPLYVLFFPFWLMKGKAHLKREIGLRVTLDVSLLPYNTGVLEYLKSQHALGRMLVLATGSDEQIVQRIANHLRLFDVIIASDGTTNMSGCNKRDRLLAEFGERKFDYVGNERRDLAVWSSSRRAILVNPTRRLLNSVAEVAEIERIFMDGKSGCSFICWLLHH